MSAIGSPMQDPYESTGCGRATAARVLALGRVSGESLVIVGFLIAMAVTAAAGYLEWEALGGRE